MMCKLRCYLILGGTCTGVEMCQATSFLVGQQDYTCILHTPYSLKYVLQVLMKYQCQKMSFLGISSKKFLRNGK